MHAYVVTVCGFWDAAIIDTSFSHTNMQSCALLVGTNKSDGHQSHPALIILTLCSYAQEKCKKESSPCVIYFAALIALILTANVLRKMMNNCCPLRARSKITKIPVPAALSLHFATVEQTSAFAPRPLLRKQYDGACLISHLPSLPRTPPAGKQCLSFLVGLVR